MTNTGRLVAALLFGVVVYGVSVAVSGFERIASSLGHFAWWTFAAAVGLASLNYVLRFAKWQYYLSRLGLRRTLPASDSALIFLSGFMLTVTPGKIGEVFKSAVLKRIHGVPVSTTAPIVVAERLTDVIGVVVLILVGSATFAGGLGWAVAGATAVLLGLVAILWSRPAYALLTRLEATRFSRHVPKLRHAYESLRLLGDPPSLGIASLLSIAGWGLEGLALSLLVSGFGHEASLGHAMFFYATATLAGALVPVPGGLGVTEAILYQQMVQIGGLPEGDATSSMILIRFATLWWAVVVGFGAFFWLRVRHPGRLSFGERD